MKAVSYDAHGGPEVLRYVDVPDPTPGPADVVVEVAACGVNRLDVVQRSGWYTLPGFSLPHIAGMDVAGTVVARGHAVPADLDAARVVVDPSLAGVAPDSRLFDAGVAGDVPGVIGATVDGGYAELCLVPASHVERVPDHVTLERAATFPTCHLTAFHALFPVGELAAGETVLIHAAGSGVSVAAIQLAIAAGATVLATAGSDAKVASALEIGAAAACNNRTTDVADWAREQTGGAGVDLVLDHVGAALFGPSLMALGRGGRLVSCGNTSGDQAEIPSLGHVYRNGISIRGAGPYTSGEFALAWSRFCESTAEAVIADRYPLAEAATAQERLAAGDVFGKLLVIP